METVEIIAQGIGIVAMAFNIISYQGRSQKVIFALQLAGTVLFSINFLMLGAIVGGVLNILGAVRAIIFLFKDKLKADSLPWFIAFMLLYAAVYVCNFTVFGKQPTLFNFMVEILPVIGMIAISIGFMRKNASDIRRAGLVSSPSWLIYNFAVGSWGAIICEVLTLTSIFIGILRLDRKK